MSEHDENSRVEPSQPQSPASELVPLEIVDGEIVEAAEAADSRPPLPGAPNLDGYTPDGIPTLNYVRQKIATSLGAAELFEQSEPAADEEARQAALRSATAAKLASLREALNDRNQSDQG